MVEAGLQQMVEEIREVFKPMDFLLWAMCVLGLGLVLIGAFGLWWGVDLFIIPFVLGAAMALKALGHLGLRRQRRKNVS